MGIFIGRDMLLDRYNYTSSRTTNELKELTEKTKKLIEDQNAFITTQNVTNPLDKLTSSTRAKKQRKKELLSIINIDFRRSVFIFSCIY